MNRIVINADLGQHKISRHIYGHFSEHLGRCIYGGFWVGEASATSNTRASATMSCKHCVLPISPICAGPAAALPTNITGKMASVRGTNALRWSTPTGVA